MSSLNLTYYNVTTNNFLDIVNYNAVFPYAFDIMLLLLFGILFATSKKLTFSLFITSVASFILLSIGYITTTETSVVFSLTVISFIIDLYKNYKEKTETYGLEKIG